MCVWVCVFALAFASSDSPAAALCISPLGLYSLRRVMFAFIRPRWPLGQRCVRRSQQPSAVWCPRVGQIDLVSRSSLASVVRVRVCVLVCTCDAVGELRGLDRGALRITDRVVSLATIDGCFYHADMAPGTPVVSLFESALHR